MDHDAPMLRLAVELRSGGGGLQGRVVDEDGAARAFSGWLGLLTLLAAVIEERP